MNVMTSPLCRCAALMGMLVLSLCGCSTSPKSGSALVPAPKEGLPLGASGNVDVGKEYRVGPDDMLRVEVFQVEGLSRKARVNSNGEIALPLVGVLSVGGLTVNQVEELLRNKLGERYLQNPQVSVSVEEFTSQRVVVDGAVKRPGVFPLTGRMTLLQLFALANGPTEDADVHKVRIFRLNANGKKDSLFYDIDAIRDGSAQDPVLQGSDVVEVEEDLMRVVWRNIKDTVRISFSTGTINAK